MLTFSPQQMFLLFLLFHSWWIGIVHVCNLIFFRRLAQSQGFSQVEIGNSPNYDNHARSGQFMAASHFTPHVSQNSPSRLGQQPTQRFTHGRRNAGRGSDWNHIKAQLPPSNSKSPRSSSFTDGVPWGTFLCSGSNLL